jgi:Fe-S-cluster containining protein
MNLEEPVPQAVLIESGSRFQCLPDCGFCCGFWDISIDGPRKEHLLQREWVQEIERDLKTRKNQPLFPIVGQTDRSIIQRQHGTCSFINDQKRCSIHAREGMDAKPLGCQQYPYIYYRTPRGVEVLLDHSCPEIIKNLGDLVTVEEVERTLPRQFVLSVPESFPLSSKTNLAWDGYSPLESALLGVLQLDLSPRDQILCLHQIAAKLSRNLEAHGSADGPIVEQLLERMTTEKLQEMLAGVRRLGGSVSKRDLYLAILIQLVEATYSRKLRDDGSASGPLFLSILKQWKGLGTQNFEVFRLGVSHAQLKTVTWDDSLPEFKDVTGRYLRYLVRSLLNTGRMPILKRLAIVSANYALVDWLARAHALEHGRARAEPDDLVFGIQIVEKFMSNRLFNELSSQVNFLAKVVHAMFDNPALPSIMLSPRS